MRSLYLVVALFSSVGIYVGTAAADEPEAVFSVQYLTPEYAEKAAKAALAFCRKSGFQVTVAVVDRSGHLQVLIRDRFAGFLTLQAAQLKAQTTASFRVDSSVITESTFNSKELSGVRQIPGFLAAAGGVVILAGGELVGAIGVAGAPQATSDELCAKAGVNSIQEQLDFN